MKRFLPVLGVAALCVGFTVLVQTIDFGAYRDPKWRPLPRGGAIAFHQVTFGSVHNVEYSQPPFLERVSDAARMGSLAPLFDKGGGTVGSGTGGDSISVWFAFRGATLLPQLENPELILPDGRTHYSKSSGPGVRTFGRGLRRMHFSVIPHTVKKLVVAATIEGERFQWEIPNPTYIPSPQTATAEARPEM